MKNFVLFALLFVLVAGASIPPDETYTPVLMLRENLEKSVKSIAAQNLENPGKIYLKDSLIFIVERFKGVHVIDDSDPANPQNIQFITVPGIADVSVKNQLLFADNAVDLVSINISDLYNVKVVSRIRNIFPELPHPEWGGVPYEYNIYNRPRNTVIVNWEKRAS